MPGAELPGNPRRKLDEITTDWPRIRADFLDPSCGWDLCR